MKGWLVVWGLGAIAILLGASLFALQWHHTLGEGAFGLGVLLVVSGVFLRSRVKSSPEPEVKIKPVAPTTAPALRKALLALVVIVVVGLATFYGVQYIAGTQTGVPVLTSQSTQSTFQTGVPVLTSQSTQSTFRTSFSFCSGLGVYCPSTTSTHTVGTTTGTSVSSSTLTQGGTGQGNNGLSSTAVSSTAVTSTGASSSAMTSTGQMTSSTSVCPGGTESLDGSAMNYNASGRSGLVPLTTQKSPDVIIVFVSILNNSIGSTSTPPTVTSISDGSRSLSFQRRAMNVTEVPNAGNDLFSEEEWYAIATAPLKNDSITVNLSANSTVITLIAFGVSGADTSSPFDPNSGVPVSTTSTTTGTISATVATSCPGDMVIGGAAMSSFAPAAGSGFTLIQSDQGKSPGQDPIAEFETVESPQSSFQVSFGNEGLQGGTQTWIVIADAID